MPDPALVVSDPEADWKAVQKDFNKEGGAQDLKLNKEQQDALKLKRVVDRWAERNGLRGVCVMAPELHSKYNGGDVPQSDYDELPDRVKTARALALRRKVQARDQALANAAPAPEPPKPRKGCMEGYLQKQDKTMTAKEKLSGWGSAYIELDPDHLLLRRKPAPKDKSTWLKTILLEKVVKVCKGEEGDEKVREGPCLPSRGRA